MQTEETVSAGRDRLVLAAERRIGAIREDYKRSKWTPQQHRDADKASDRDFISTFESRYQNGDMTLEALNKLKADLESISATVGTLPDEAYASRTSQEGRARWTFQHTQHGKITITDEGSRNWRTATVEDIGSIVLDYNTRSGRPEFGEFDDIEKEPDEEFPDDDDEARERAIVYHQNGHLNHSPSAFGGIFEDLFVVPTDVLEGIKDEAPPGRYFSGRSIRGGETKQWSPAPEGMVWFDHPFLTNGPKYFTDSHYYCVKRTIECPGWAERQRQDLDSAIRCYQEQFLLQFWCPVKRKFMSEAEIRRQEHWFHNGDGSAQQRYYYTQNEMLDRHGGLSSLPTATAGDDPVITQVLSASQLAHNKFKRAEQNGDVIELE